MFTATAQATRTCAFELGLHGYIHPRVPPAMHSILLVTIIIIEPRFANKYSVMLQSLSQVYMSCAISDMGLGRCSIWSKYPARSSTVTSSM